MGFYESNLGFFQNNLKTMYDILIHEESQFKSEVSLIDSLNIRVESDHKSCKIHSIYSIERETSAMFSAVDDDAENIAVFGMGLWHCRNHIRDHYKNLKHLIIIEPDLNIFKEALNCLNIYDLLKLNKNITFIVNRSVDEAIDMLWDIFRVNVTSKMEFVYNLSYRSLFSEYYDALHHGIIARIRNTVINVATTNYTLYKSMKNVLVNYKQKAIPLTKLISNFDNIPIIIVSAGPSLNYNMQYLNEAKSNAVILAVGSAIKILDSNGIVPHFRIAIDPNESEGEVFKDINTENSPLLFVDSLYPGVVGQYLGNKIRMVLDTDFFSQYIFKELYGEVPLVPSGFSVANVALEVAIELGFKKIILMGQDLCYTGGKLYAKGSWDKNEDKINFEREGYTKCVNILGEEVYTSKVFLGMKNILELSIKANPNITYINATERGLNIAGTINKPFIKVMIEDLSENRNVDQLIERILLQSQIDENNWMKKLDKLNLDEIIHELNMINNYRIKKLIKLKKQAERDIEIKKLTKELDRIEADAEQQFNGFEFYHITIKPSMSIKYYAIHLRYQYHGTDEKKLLDSKIESTLGEAAELKIYLDSLIRIMSEDR